MVLDILRVDFERNLDKKYKTVVNDLLYQNQIEYNSMNKKVPLWSKEEIATEYHLNYPYYPQEIYLAFLDDKVIGFCIIGYGENCHPDADIFICELYIKPKYRLKGYGKRFITALINGIGNINAVCMYILNGNTAAEKFWHKVFKGWRWLRTPDCEPSEEVKAYLILR